MLFCYGFYCDLPLFSMRLGAGAPPRPPGDSAGETVAGASVAAAGSLSAVREAGASRTVVLAPLSGRRSLWLSS